MKFIAVTYWNHPNKESLFNAHQGLMFLEHDLTTNNIKIDIARGVKYNFPNGRGKIVLSDLYGSNNIANIRNESFYIYNKNFALKKIEFLPVSDEKYYELKNKIEGNNTLLFNFLAINGADNCRSFVMKTIYGDNYSKDLFNIPKQSNDMYTSQRIGIDKITLMNYSYDNLNIPSHDFPICEITNLNKMIFKSFTDEEKAHYLKYQIKYAFYKLEKIANSNSAIKEILNPDVLLKIKESFVFNDLIEVINTLLKRDLDKDNPILHINIVNDFLSLTKNLKKYGSIITGNKFEEQSNLNKTIISLNDRVNRESYPYFLVMIIHFWNSLSFKLDESFDRLFNHNNRETKAYCRS